MCLLDVHIICFCLTSFKNAGSLLGSRYTENSGGDDFLFAFILWTCFYCDIFLYELMSRILNKRGLSEQYHMLTTYSTLLLDREHMVRFESKLLDHSQNYKKLLQQLTKHYMAYKMCCALIICGGIRHLRYCNVNVYVACIQTTANAIFSGKKQA